MDWDDIGSAGLAICVLVLAFLAGSACIQDREHARAVEAHVGYWMINAETGKTEFVYGVKP